VKKKRGNKKLSEERGIGKREGNELPKGIGIVFYGTQAIREGRSANSELALA